MHHYYTDEPDILFKEYGRYVQKAVEWIKDIEDTERRTKLAYALVELMRQLNPQGAQETQDYNQKLWDHLHVMAGYKLEVEGPYPIPEPERMHAKPTRIPYAAEKVRFKTYGRNIEHLVKKAIEIEDAEEKEMATLYIGRLMKQFYSAWNKEMLEDTVIAKQLEKMSEGQLKVNLEMVQEGNLFSINPRELRMQSTQPGNSILPQRHAGRQGGRFEGREGRDNREGRNDQRSNRDHFKRRRP